MAGYIIAAIAGFIFVIFGPADVEEKKQEAVYYAEPTLKSRPV